MIVSVWMGRDLAWYWDDSEDHGGFDRISPDGPHKTEQDARESARWFSPECEIEAGPPLHYVDAMDEPESYMPDDFGDRWRAQLEESESRGRGYPQSFVLVMESGEVVRAVVRGEDPPHGLGLAHAAAQERFPGVQVWDDCTAPLSWSGDEWPPESVEILKGGDAFSEGEAAHLAGVKWWRNPYGATLEGRAWDRGHTYARRAALGDA